MRVILARSDDAVAIDRLQSALSELGWLPDDTWHDTPLGTGLTRFRRGTQELTVYIDAWDVDAVGEESALQELTGKMAEG